MVNYDMDMWPHMSHILKPLTAKTGTPKKGENPFISMDTRHSKSIWPNESINGCWCIMCIPWPQQAFPHLPWCIWLPTRCMHHALHITSKKLIVHRWIMVQLIQNYSVPLQHYENSIKCCLVLNFTFTQTTTTFSIWVTRHRDVFTGSHMLMNMGQNFTMWKAHTRLLLTRSYGFCTIMRAHP